MADEEAEQESGGLGGDLLELRRLRERLLELETGLRESAEPAVQAATEYCKQLCQVRRSSSPLPSFPPLRAGCGRLPMPGRSSGLCPAAAALSPEERAAVGPGRRSAAGSWAGRPLALRAGLPLDAEDGRPAPCARSRSAGPRSPAPAFSPPRRPPRVSRSPGPFVVLYGSAQPRALCSRRRRRTDPPPPLAPPRPLLSRTPPPRGAAARRPGSSAGGGSGSAARALGALGRSVPS